MSSDRLTNTEATILRFAVQRYDRPFFRWGHLLGWLLIPLGALNFAPAAKPYTLWTNNAAIMCMFFWYSVLVTRVIGKLAVRLNPSAVNTPAEEVNTPSTGNTSNSDVNSSIGEAIKSKPRSFRDALLVLAALFWVVTVVVLTKPGRPWRLVDLFISVLGDAIAIGVLVGLAIMVAGYAVYFSGRRALGNRLFQVGFYVTVLSFIAVFTCGPVLLHLLGK